MAKGRKPDYRISCLNKDTDETGIIGAAWANPEGYISLVFNPFVTVPVGSNFIINLFRNLPLDAKDDQNEIPF